MTPAGGAAEADAETTRPRVTVIVPTFDHTRTLELSVPTALAQTVPELEVLVIGDGAPDETREIVARLTAEDPRVQYLSYPKGERTGEPHRHDALSTVARGDVVFYLSDDDLWLPDHVETMLATMEATGANFVSCQPTWLMPEPRAAHRWVVDLAHPFYRAELLASRNRVPLSCGAHTMELYRALPHGWRTTPRGTPTDLYMWQQLLAHPDCRSASTPYTTVLGLPDSQRPDQSLDARIAELTSWTPLTDPAVHARFLRATQAADAGLIAHATFEAEFNVALGVVSELESRIETLLEQAAQQAAEAATTRRAAEELAEARYQELVAIHASRVWRGAEAVRGVARRVTRRA